MRERGGGKGRKKNVIKKLINEFAVVEFNVTILDVISKFIYRLNFIIPREKNN